MDADFASVRVDDRFADGQADAHAFPGVGRGSGCGGRGVKDAVKFFRRDAVPVVSHAEADKMLVVKEPAFHGAGTAGVIVRVLQKIEDDLFNQQRIHGGDQKIFRDLCADRLIGITFFRCGDGVKQDFFRRFRRFFEDVGAALGDAGDRQQILHHVQKPVGVFVDLSDQLPFFFGRKRCFVLQPGRAGADHAGKGRAQIVGDGPQKVGPELFFFRFHDQLFIFFDTGRLFFCMKGSGAGHDGDKIHHQEGKRITGHGKIKLMKRIGIQIVNAENTENRGQDAVAVFVRITGDQDDRQDIDQADIGHAGGVDPVIEGREQRCGGRGADGEQQAEMRMEGVSRGEGIHEPGKTIPDVFSHKRLLSASRRAENPQRGYAARLFSAVQRTSIFLRCSFRNGRPCSSERTDS